MDRGPQHREAAPIDTLRNARLACTAKSAATGWQHMSVCVTVLTAAGENRADLYAANRKSSALSDAKRTFCRVMQSRPPKSKTVSAFTWLATAITSAKLS